jgi:hypothetical protein
MGTMAHGMKRYPGKDVIGHPDLASGAQWDCGDIVYVSYREAIDRRRFGMTSRIAFPQDLTEEDEANVADLRERAQARWREDKCSVLDGWGRQPNNILRTPRVVALTVVLTRRGDHHLRMPVIENGRQTGWMTACRQPIPDEIALLKTHYEFPVDCPHCRVIMDLRRCHARPC